MRAGFLSKHQMGCALLVHNVGTAYNAESERGRRDLHEFDDPPIYILHVSPLDCTGNKRRVLKDEIRIQTAAFLKRASTPTFCATLCVPGASAVPDIHQLPYACAGRPHLTAGPRPQRGALLVNLFVCLCLLFRINTH